MPSDTLIIIFGAAVLEDGNASGALLRRVRGALTAARELDCPLFLPTGGVGRHGDAEAEVIKRLLLDAGVDNEQIICEMDAHNTMSSVLNCASIIREMPNVRRITICSDRYHIPRCVLLFRMLGIDTIGLRIESGFTTNGAFRWLKYYLRECLAIIVDLPIMLIKLTTLDKPLDQ